MRFLYTISHVPNKHLYTADALSRAPVASPDNTHVEEDDLQRFWWPILYVLPANADSPHKYHMALQKPYLLRAHCPLQDGMTP